MQILPWQETQWQRLVSQANARTLPHAFLFSGQAGIGKAQFAKSLAAFLLCDDKAAAASRSKACGNCKQCKLFEAETHPDFKLIQPEEGAASIKVDQIRNLVEFFGQSSLQGGRKVTVLMPAESMNINAANALLKTLEEPSANSVIILVSHQAGMLLPTIRSRCQVVDFSIPSESQATNWLMTQAEVLEAETQLSAEDLRQVLNLAYQAPFKALDYLNTQALKEYRTMLDELSVFLKNEKLSSELANRWNDDLAQLRLSWMIHWLEQLLKLKLESGMAALVHGELMFNYLADKCTAQQLFELYSECLQQYRLFSGTSNPNKVLAFEMLLHRWSGLMRKS
jgi:DNA polymerase-3 subunit delta'